MDLPTNPSAPSSVMATQQYVPRMYAVNRRRSNRRSYRRNYKAPARRAVRRKYSYKRSPNQGIRLEVPECSQHYIKALYDPWSVPAGVCIPCDLFPLPSQKVKAKVRFTVQLSSNGCAFVNLSPSIANDIASGSYTTIGSTGGTTSVFTAGASWTQAEIFFQIFLILRQILRQMQQYLVVL